jgi:hypothetical protein
MFISSGCNARDCNQFIISFRRFGSHGPTMAWPSASSSAGSHSFRCSALTASHQAGLSLREVAAISGHRSLAALLLAPPPACRPGPAPACRRGPACPSVGTLQQHPTPAPPMPTPADDLAQLLAAVLDYRPQPWAWPRPRPTYRPHPCRRLPRLRGVLRVHREWRL